MFPIKKRLIVVGGGAAGLFGAITAASRGASVILLERTNQLLSKVRISGGGRCNVTHACLDPRELIKNYPRGHKELLGPFTRFGPQETIAWFEERGVPLKTERDGRMFPLSDRSESIIDCLLTQAQMHGVDIRLVSRIEGIFHEEGRFILSLHNAKMECDSLLLATGSNPHGHALARSLGHTITPLVPSLFTFNSPTSPLHDLSGVSVDDATLTIADSPFTQRGPLLITHFGFSGPAVLKLSAWAARFLHENNYRATLRINWISTYDASSTLTTLKSTAPSRPIGGENPFHLPRQLWKRLLAPLDPHKRLADLTRQELSSLLTRLTTDSYIIEGKTTHKEEFVTCGGIHLKEINFKTLESRITPSLFFAGEILDIDAVTGGFNFQNAWTTSFIAGNHIAI